MEDIIFIFVYSGIVYWCTWIAQKNKRNVPLAAFWGALFGIFAVAVYYIMGTKSEDIYKNVKECENEGKTDGFNHSPKIE